jgi:hypothetical protein
VLLGVLVVRRGGGGGPQRIPAVLKLYRCAKDRRHPGGPEKSLRVEAKIEVWSLVKSLENRIEGAERHCRAVDGHEVLEHGVAQGPADGLLNGARGCRAQ